MSSYINRALLFACFYGNYKKCVELVADGANVNYQCGLVNPLFWTVVGCPPTRDRLKIIKLLFNNGCKIPNIDCYLKQALSNSHKFDNDIPTMKQIVKIMLPKIRGWYTYDFSEWTDVSEYCIEEQERLRTIYKVLHKTPLPMDTKRYLCEWI